MNIKMSIDILVYVKGNDNITTLYQDISYYVNIFTCVIFCHQILQDRLANRSNLAMQKYTIPYRS